MPQIVEKQIVARSARIGDQIQFPGSSYIEIVSDVAIPRSPNAKYMVISTDYGNTRTLMGTEITAWREEPTEEESEAAQRDYTHRWIRKSMREAAENVIRTKAALIDSLDMKSVYWHGRRWEAYAEAQVTEQVWLDVVEVSLNRGLSLVDAVIFRKNAVKDKIIQDLRGNRSSHAMSNTADDVERDAQARWIRDLDYVFL